MANALNKITARAKQIRKAHPSMAWSAAIKKASAEYRGSVNSKVKRFKKATVTINGPKKKKAAKKVTRVKARTVVIAGAKKKKAAPKKRTTGGGYSIGAVAHSKLGVAIKDLERYQRELKNAREKKQPQKVRAGWQKLITAARKNITALKRSI